MTALMLAASESESISVLESILKREQNVNLTDQNGRTALHFATGKGQPKHVQVLLNTPGIDRNARTNGGNSPLMNAVGSGDIKSTIHCLNAGCNPFLENGLGETA